MTPYYDEDGITIYHGDCREIAPLLKADVLLTDPPYGMHGNHGSRAKTAKQPDGNLWGTQWGPMTGDDVAFDPRPFLSLVKDACCWGANHYSDKLPGGCRWLVWDKGTPPDMSYSDCELAWTSVSGGGVWKKDILWSGFRRALEVREHYHPTQKPIALMKWCLDIFSVGVVLDPFMGSGTTLRAAKDLGRKAIGIEIEERYCEIAAKRLRQRVLDFSERQA